MSARPWHSGTGPMAPLSLETGCRRGDSPVAGHSWRGAGLGLGADLRKGTGGTARRVAQATAMAHLTGSQFPA